MLIYRILIQPGFYPICGTAGRLEVFQYICKPSSLLVHPATVFLMVEAQTNMEVELLL